MCFSATRVAGRACGRPMFRAAGWAARRSRWLAGMPPVPNHALPALAGRLRALGLVHQVVLPLPEQHAQPLSELGELPLQPVLRLLTCPNVPSETWLEGHQRPPPAGQPLRQAAAQLLLRLRTDRRPWQRAGGRFQLPGRRVRRGVHRTARPRASRPEPADALSARLRWPRPRPRSGCSSSSSCGRGAGSPTFALDRMAALKAGRLQASALPPALEDGLLVLVPSGRDPLAGGC